MTAASGKLSEHKSGDKRRYLLIIATAIFLLYGKTVNYQLIGFDDSFLLKSDKSILQSESVLIDAFTSDVFKGTNSNAGEQFYRPVFLIALHFIDLVGNGSLKAFHGFNILLHVLVCLLLFNLLISIGASAQASYAGTLIYSVHPAFGMAVAWIPGINDLLLTIFVIGAFLQLNAWLKSGSGKHFVLHLLLLMLALFTKETAIMFPVLAALWIYTHHGAKSKKPKLLLVSSAYLLVVITWMSLRHIALGGTNIFDRHLSEINNNLIYLLQHATQMMIPVYLTGISPINSKIIWLSIPALALLIYIFYKSKQQNSSMALFGLIWTLSFLIPTLLSPAPEAGAIEHRTYLPAVGLTLMLIQLPWIEKAELSLTFKKIAWMIIPGIFITLSFLNLGHFRNAESFWSHFTQIHSHSGKGWITLGNFYELTGDLNNAEQAYVKADQINDENVSAKLTLGEFYLNQGMHKKAENILLIALKDHAGDAKVFNNLGLSYLGQGLIPQAKETLEKGLAINPQEPRLHNSLGIIYFQSHEYGNAEKEFLAEIQIDPEYADAYFNLALVYRDLNRRDDMIRMLQQTLRIEPEHKQAAKALLFLQQQP